MEQWSCLQQGKGLENCHQPDKAIEVLVKGIQESVAPFKSSADLDAAPSSATDLLQVHGHIALPGSTFPLWVCLTSSMAQGRGCLVTPRNSSIRADV